MTTRTSLQIGVPVDEHGEIWRQTAASFALEGITLDADDKERAGRVLAGELTLEEAYAEIRQQLDVTVKS